MSKQKTKKSSKKIILPESVIREIQEQKLMKSLNPTSMKEQIYEYKRRVNTLIAQLNKLNVEIAENNEQHLESTFGFQKTLKIQENTLNELKQNYKTTKETNKLKLKEARENWEKERQEIISKKNKEIADFNDKCKEINRKLEHIQIFKSKQAEFVAKIEDLKGKIEKIEDVHKHELNKIKREHTIIRTKIEQDSKRLIEEIKQIEHRNAQQKLGEKEKHTKKQNQILFNQIQLYEQEEKALLAEGERLKEQIKEQQKQLKQLNLSNPTYENHERSLKIINLQDKMNQLKTYITEQTKRLQEEGKSTKKFYDERQKELENEIKRGRDSIKKKERQCKDLRMYSQMVLDQRGHLEWYLLEVLNEHEDLKLDDFGDIDNILRFLFIKINSGIPPKSWRKYESDQKGYEHIVPEEGESQQSSHRSQN